MPADHLTTASCPASPYQFASAVLAVLAGSDLETTAADSGMDPADLHDALQAYQAAGLAALEQRAEQQWYQVRVQFPDWDTAEADAAARLGPRLDQLEANGAVTGWWFLRKHPCWRLRLRAADTAAVDHVLDELTAAGVLSRWWPTVYEPETTAFGGPVGMHAVHELFCADSRGVFDYARRDAPGLGRRELSLLLINALLYAARLDGFERGDVFDRVTHLRPAPSDADAARIDTLTANVRTLLAVPAQPGSALFAPDGPAAFAAPWLAAFTATGRLLGQAAAQGRLERGLRAILTHVLIFHWNRLGLLATTQAILARAAGTALLPRS
ncbi:thiopeptide-type bacteriocin biosynthesis protein [Sphaerimonospora mesophila]|uniref:thiopeptide-type bacteriocin biosynthesis protein n=1 Tax=Sphaerimonospora mesophila TaxID=37483 RepID=UPI0006E24180